MPRASRQEPTRLPLKLGVGALAVLLLAAPFVPGGDGDQGAVRPSAGEDASAQAAALMHATAGESAITPAAQAEIDRVVNEGLASGRGLSARATPTSLVTAQVKCAEFEGQRYCLHTGWTDESASAVLDEVSTEATRLSARRVTGAEPGLNTGDADILTTLQASARLSPTARAAADRAELTAAARSVAKVWLIRNQIQGVPLPEGFLDRHPEVNTEPASSDSLARGSATATASASASASPTRSATGTPSPSAAPTTKSNRDYPQRRHVLDPTKVAEQSVSYYCGPTSMQMIAWNWSGKRRSQAFWADKLGTTSNGSAITDLVRVTNERTGWDKESYAGPYIVLDIKDFSYQQWMLLNLRHIVDYKAPLIFHPVLLKEFYPYLDDNASGHFQVGRGYNKRGKKTNLVSFFEPWNQQRFDPSEPYIERVQNRMAYKSYRANLAHFQHNIGV